MRRTGPWTALTCAAALLAATATSAATPRAIDVYDRTTGAQLPVYEHRGRQYVAGEPGHEYEIRLRNRTNGRQLAVVSVDGVNVITGATADPAQSGYVLDAWQNMSVEGWRKNLSRVATFYFTAVPDSYASRTGRPENVGVIGVAWFRENTPPCCVVEESAAAADAAPPAAPQAEAARKSAGSATGEARARSAAPQLGTGHGRNQASAAQYTAFERASSEPEELTVLYYDSYQRLLARGIIPRPRALAERRPDPFPGQFVPDP